MPLKLNKGVAANITQVETNAKSADIMWFNFIIKNKQLKVHN